MGYELKELNQHSLVRVNYHILVGRHKHVLVLLLNQAGSNKIKRSAA
jgi:hypothetical protein